MRVTLFSKPDCPLCDEIRSELDSLRTEIPHELREVDITSDPALHQQYFERVPVVKVGPYTLSAPISSTDLRVTLGAAADREADPEVQAQPSRRNGVGLHKVVYWFSRHWLAVFNSLIFLYVALPFAAPALMRSGLEPAANVIYRVYSPLCHQLTFRSWFLFGEEAAYPLEETAVFSTTYSDISGSDQVDYIEASRYVGDEVVGFKVALCQRDIAIYGGILVAGLVFGLVRSRVRPVPILLWFVIGILPLAIDGGSQLISRLPFLGIPLRESTPLLRTVTGLLFAVMNVWLAYPNIDDAMKDTQALTATKLVAAEAKDRED